MKFFKLDEQQGYILRKAAFLFVLVSAVLTAADQVSIRCSLNGWERMLDDLLGGLIAASIFSWYERRRLQRLAQSLRAIDLLNHDIRNSLQPLMFLTGEVGTTEHTRLVEECVRHVDGTLRELLRSNSKLELTVHDGGLASRRIPNRLVNPRSSQVNSSLQEPDWKSHQVFTHWLHTWRSRNLGERQ